MHRDEYLAHLELDGRRMAELAAGDLQAPVPTCPEWTLVDLVEHTGFVHRWQTAAVRDRVSAFPEEGTWRHGPGDGESWAAWFQRGVDEAVAVMSAVEGSEERWTWFPPDHTAQWYFRRITQETAVHRVDAELAAASPTPIAPALAVDGVEEMFDVFVPSSGPTPVGGNGETVHLHATDADGGEWLITMLSEGIEVERGHAKGDAALRATASDLLLYVWGRPTIGEVERIGDENLIDKLHAAFKI